MKTAIVKTLSVIAATGVLLTSLGASAADTHKCQPGEKYDTMAKACVTSK